MSLIGQNYYLYDTRGGVDWTEAKSARKNRSESKPWFRAPCLLGAFELLSEEPSLPAMTIRSVGACKRRVRRRLRSGMARWKARFLRAGALWRNCFKLSRKPIVTCPTSLGRKGAACSWTHLRHRETILDRWHVWNSASSSLRKEKSPRRDPRGVKRARHMPRLARSLKLSKRTTAAPPSLQVTTLRLMV